MTYTPCISSSPNFYYMRLYPKSYLYILSLTNVSKTQINYYNRLKWDPFDNRRWGFFFSSSFFSFSSSFSSLFFCSSSFFSLSFSSSRHNSIISGHLSKSLLTVKTLEVTKKCKETNYESPYHPFLSTGKYTFYVVEEISSIVLSLCHQR